MKDAISRVHRLWRLVGGERKKGKTDSGKSTIPWKTRLLSAPDNLWMAAKSAWIGRERGLAVFAGVFLASLVITTVLAYGVGLSQLAL